MSAANPAAETPIGKASGATDRSLRDFFFSRGRYLFTPSNFSATAYYSLSSASVPLVVCCLAISRNWNAVA